MKDFKPPITNQLDFGRDFWEPLFVQPRQDGRWMLVLDKSTSVFDDYDAAVAAYHLVFDSLGLER